MTSTLIIGATGLLGSEMAKASAHNGDRLHVLVRPATAGNEERLRPLKEFGAKIHVGDLDDYDSLVRAAGAVDRVISSVHVDSASEMTLRTLGSWPIALPSASIRPSTAGSRIDSAGPSKNTWKP